MNATAATSGIRASAMAIAVNFVLAFVKIATGLIGNSYALVADGIESTTDIFSSMVVWSGLRISTKPPDKRHPYGHGKAESIAGVVVSAFLLVAAILIAVQSIREIVTPHKLPAWYTIPVLALVVVTKETLFRFVFRVGDELASTALLGDAWHHRADALTSLAAFVGISIALLGGKGYESADDWAALLACAVIIFNGVRILRPALAEVMDTAVPVETERSVRRIAQQLDGVLDVEKCRIRKSGLGLLMDIHVTVDGDLTVRQGHDIGHQVKERLLDSDLPIQDIVVHVEPHHLRET
ncbi:cation diffusion facilitator family transporter [bacterium]|nr:cation diffusion facilitator family transporter [bacterium]